MDKDLIGFYFLMLWLIPYLIRKMNIIIWAELICVALWIPLGLNVRRSRKQRLGDWGLDFYVISGRSWENPSRRLVLNYWLGTWSNLLEEIWGWKFNCLNCVNYDIARMLRVLGSIDAKLINSTINWLFGSLKGLKWFDCLS